MKLQRVQEGITLNGGSGFTYKCEFCFVRMKLIFSLRTNVLLMLNNNFTHRILLLTSVFITNSPCVFLAQCRYFTVCCCRERCCMSRLLQHTVMRKLVYKYGFLQGLCAFGLHTELLSSVQTSVNGALLCWSYLLHFDYGKLWKLIVKDFQDTALLLPHSCFLYAMSVTMLLMKNIQIQ